MSDTTAEVLVLVHFVYFTITLQLRMYKYKWVTLNLHTSHADCKKSELFFGGAANQVGFSLTTMFKFINNSVVALRALPNIHKSQSYRLTVLELRGVSSRRLAGNLSNTCTKLKLAQANKGYPHQFYEYIFFLFKEDIKIITAALTNFFLQQFNSKGLPNISYYWDGRWGKCGRAKFEEEIFR